MIRLVSVSSVLRIRMAWDFSMPASLHLPSAVPADSLLERWTWIPSLQRRNSRTTDATPMDPVNKSLTIDLQAFDPAALKSRLTELRRYL